MSAPPARGAPAPPSATVTWGSGPGRGVLAATVLGSAVAMLDATVVNVALPTIGRELNASVADLQWISSGYLLSLAALILVGGSMGDRYGRRRIFMVGVVWFAAASLLCGLAPTVGVLVAARVLQGVGAALLTPGSLAIIQATFAPGDRSRAIGAWSGLSGVAAAVGPFLGGLLVEVWSWRLAFLVNLPVAVATVWLAVRFVPESRDVTVTGRLDMAGALLGAAGLGGVTAALIMAPERGGTDGLVLALLIGGLAALAGFVVVERRGRHPMLPLGIFASRGFVAANLVTFTVYAALGGVFFLLVVQLQVSLGYSPTAAGVASLPVTLLLLLLSARSGALAQRIGPKLQLVAGPLLIAAALVLMTRIAPGAGYLEGVLPSLLVFGLGLAALVAPVTATALATADERHAGVASGVNNAVARVGGLLAVAILPAVAGLTGEDYTDPQVLTAGFRIAVLVCAGLSAVGGLIALAMIDNRALRQQPAEPPRPAERERYHCGVDAPPAGVGAARR